MAPRRIAFLAIALVLPALMLAPRTASAHAFPASESPAAGSTIAVAPSEVVLVFNAPIESMFSKLQVTNSDSADVCADSPVLAKDHRRASVKLKPLVPGEYTVKWIAVSEDGHRTQGSYVFTVSAPTDR